MKKMTNYSFWDDIEDVVDLKMTRLCISQLSRNCKKKVLGYKADRVCHECKNVINGNTLYNKQLESKKNAI